MESPRGRRRNRLRLGGRRVEDRTLHRLVGLPPVERDLGSVRRRVHQRRGRRGSKRRLEDRHLGQEGEDRTITTVVVEVVTVVVGLRVVVLHLGNRAVEAVAEEVELRLCNNSSSSSRAMVEEGMDTMVEEVVVTMAADIAKVEVEEVTAMVTVMLEVTVVGAVVRLGK